MSFSEAVSRDGRVGRVGAPGLTLARGRPAAKPPAPTLRLGWWESALRRPGEDATLECVAPLDGGVYFQLRRGGEEESNVSMSSSSPGRVSVHLRALAPGAGGAYTCRYRLGGAQGWSEDSEAQELRLNDGGSRPWPLRWRRPRASRAGRRAAVPLPRPVQRCPRHPAAVQLRARASRAGPGRT